jgi:2-keto-3-deoxy-L-rhamnonate aldolase RhmA
MEENTKMSEVVAEVKNAGEDELREIIEQHFEAVRAQGMKIGATYIAAAISGVIEKNLKNGMNSSHRDFQRAIKRIIEIVSVQLKQEETLQNDSEEMVEEVTNDE